MKKPVIVAAVVVALVALSAAVLFLSGVLDDPFDREIDRATAAAKAADYVAAEHPELSGATQMTNENDAMTYWEFGYRTDTQESIEGEQVTVTRIVIVRVDKETGEVSAYTSN